MDLTTSVAKHPQPALYAQAPVPPTSTHPTALSASSKDSHVSTLLSFASRAKQLPPLGTLLSVPLILLLKPPQPTEGNGGVMERMYLLFEFRYLLLTVRWSPWQYFLFVILLSWRWCVRRAGGGNPVLFNNVLECKVSEIIAGHNGSS